MAHIIYQDKRFLAKSVAIIKKAVEIIEEYQKMGYTLTVRQLYYQFIAQAVFPNTERSYKRLVSIINDARIAGLIDWDLIEDRTRNLQGLNHYDGPSDFLHNKAEGFHIDCREGQKVYLEAWVEKEALVSVIERPCVRYDVDFFACRGYVSQSEQHVAALRIRDKLRESDAEEAVILHFGDHDPSGIDMTRDIEDRMKMFLSYYGLDHQFRIERLALNMNQVRELRPPENPAKISDSRFRAYMDKFGDKSWELDALKPTYINKLAKDAIEGYTDIPMWEARRKEEAEGKTKLLDAASKFDADEEDSAE